MKKLALTLLIITALVLLALFCGELREAFQGAWR